MDLILHHYDFSNYAEKVRLALGFKGIDWYSVIVPSTAPKPELTPLTGGYRRTPVLQIGADIFCDTRRIMLELERLRPEPTFHPSGLGATANMIAYWAENQFFRPISLYVSGSNLDVLPDNLQADRSRMRGMPEPSPETVCRAAKRNAPLARVQIDWVDSLFADGRDWATGTAVTVADFALYHTLWFLTARTDRLAFELENCLHIQAWMARMEQFGHGTRHEMSAQMALDAAAGTEPVGIITTTLSLKIRLAVLTSVSGLMTMAVTRSNESLWNWAQKKSVCAAGTRGATILSSIFRDWDMTSGQFGDSMYFNYLQPKR